MTPASNEPPKRSEPLFDPTVSQLGRDDQLLMERLRARDGNALAAIEARHGEELRLFCRRMTGEATVGEDIVQELLAVCCGLEVESLPTSSIRGWLYQLARRRCIDVLRKRRDAAGPLAFDRRRTQRSFESAVDPLTTPAGKALKRDRAERVLAALDDLDEDLRSVIVMRYFQNLSREEIAEAIGLGLAGTKTRLSKAMDVLREKLAGIEESQG